MSRIVVEFYYCSIMSVNDNNLTCTLLPLFSCQKNNQKNTNYNLMTQFFLSVYSSLPTQRFLSTFTYVSRKMCRMKWSYASRELKFPTARSRRAGRRGRIRFQFEVNGARGRLETRARTMGLLTPKIFYSTVGWNRTTLSLAYKSLGCRPSGLHNAPVNDNHYGRERRVPLFFLALSTCGCSLLLFALSSRDCTSVSPRPLNDCSGVMLIDCMYNRRWELYDGFDCIRRTNM